MSEALSEETRERLKDQKAGEKIWERAGFEENLTDGQGCIQIFSCRFFSIGQ